MGFVQDNKGIGEQEIVLGLMGWLMCWADGLNLCWGFELVQACGPEPEHLLNEIVCYVILILVNRVLILDGV